MKKKIKSIILIVVGAMIAFYPWISNYMNDRMEKSKVEAYKEDYKNLSEERKKALLREARAYNVALFEKNVRLGDPFGTKSEEEVPPFIYNNLLRVNSSGVMAEIRIPCIDVDLPVYHGTSKSVLERGVGHFRGSSLPVGGETTHAVLTGHTGLNRAKLFTDLTQLEDGDLFFIETCGEKLAYKVDQIKVVLPDKTEDLQIVKGKDYVTLVTCTPYGVNSHRLLVRGERTEYIEGMEDNIERKPASESQWMNAYRDGIFIGIIILLFLLNITRIYKIIKYRKSIK